MIRPTIGRCVWYREAALSDQFCDAHIVYVHSDEVVNLAVFDRYGHFHSRTSVRLTQGEPEECGAFEACWMPYQRQQAEQAKKD